ncbi:50S ribosomal protein L31 [Patescibacteria group bacterium]|nr:50S ribosomal protein L31 [Patescibacteria group bacterium]
MAKKDIHPTYHQEVTVQCICGNSFKVNAAVEGPLKVETCPACHPIYTGKKETKVSKGRMEKFIEKQKKMDSLKA